MSHQIPATGDPVTGVAASVGRLLAQVGDRRLAALPVTLRFWDASVLPAASSTEEPMTVVVAHPRAVAHLLHAPGQLGLARAWVDGTLRLEGDFDELLRLRHHFAGLTLSAADRARLAAGAVRIAGRRVLRAPPIPALEAPRSGRLHSLQRDRQAIHHHYDVSNRFYRMLLGPSMVYSCAYFGDPDEGLDRAQERKLDRICRKLRLAPGERLLDVGCGWGALLSHAAEHYGVRGVGVTLSEAQCELARERLAERGLSDRVTVRVSDYRELDDGPFDKIASVGMYEHVGREQLDGYVRTLQRLLVPGGLVLNHGIARLHSEGATPGSFISRYIFPDGELHPVTDVMASMRTAGLEVRDVEAMREHYGMTLRRWVTNLDADHAAVVAEIGEARARVWRLYLLGSAQSFEDAEITIYQVLASHSGAPAGLPLDRSRLMQRSTAT